MRKPITLFLALFAAGCTVGQHNTGDAERVSCPYGEHLHNQKVDGFIYGNITTKISLKACPERELWLNFIGGNGPSSYTSLVNIAGKHNSNIGFSATLNGYIVKDGRGDSIFLALGVDHIQQRPDLVVDAHRQTDR